MFIRTGFFLLVASAAFANPNVATITKLDGQVQIFSNPGKAMQGPPPHALFEGEYYSVRDAKMGEKVENGNIVRSAVGGQAKLVYENGDQVHVGPATAYRVKWEGSEKKQSTTFSLLYGKLRNVVSKNGPRNGMQVKAGSATMGVRGTDFYVTKRGVSNTAEVVTLRGAVAVKTEAAQKPIEVKQGFTATVAAEDKEKNSAVKEAAAKEEKKDAKVAKNDAPKVEPKKVEPVVELKATTQQELEEIKKVTEIKAAPKVEETAKTEAAKAEDAKKAEEIKKLEEKAVQTTLTDIKTYDPKMYEQLKNKVQSSEDLGTKTVEKIAKTAPVAPKSNKPSEEDLDRIEADSYDKYFKKVD